MSYVDSLKKASELVSKLIQDKKCNPILVRLAWHDAGTYNKDISDWPKCGGANGSIRFAPEINHGANAGLVNAVNMLEEIHKEVPEVSYADLYQMASALSVELAGGPKIPMKYGRVDVESPEGCMTEGNLPDGNPPFHTGDASPEQHLRTIFHRMGLTDQDIVALSGAHTIGRAYPSRSGEGKESTVYTANLEGQTSGGSSWTKEFLKFDNSYFKEVQSKSDPELLVLSTDAAIFTDPAFQPFAEKYANDQDAFFADYAVAHMKLSELGVKWAEGTPVTLEG
eukprot:TRINITY_DN1834_c0_g1_i7.p2 TRINITY_DN1834_c0_g1~~TRINITY_DN1834_c0_g1_i7.p2  ORF type:complete len:282 (+),score=47.38 TRINITY_DN1834_c0_g1_i7:188-1033(+)